MDDELYPMGSVYIVKLKNKTYFAFLENREGTKIRFFDSNKVIPSNELLSYIQEKYGRLPIRVRCLGEARNDAKKYMPEHQLKGTTHYPFHLRKELEMQDEFPIIFDIEDAKPSKPSDNSSDYEGVNEDIPSTRRGMRILDSRMKSAWSEYENELAKIPSFKAYEEHYQYYATEREINFVMEWLESRDPEKDPEPPQRSDKVLDF